MCGETKRREIPFGQIECDQKMVGGFGLDVCVYLTKQCKASKVGDLQVIVIGYAGNSGGQVKGNGGAMSSGRPLT